MSELKLPEIILLKFSIIAENISSSNLLSIRGADIGYSEDNILLENINLSLGGRESIAICGKNSSGKSTLLKSLLAQKEIYTTGSWYLPRYDYIGYGY